MPLYEQKKDGPVLRVHKHKDDGGTELNVTPLVDMFTIMLIFLLLSFSAGGQLQRMADDIMMPLSQSEVMVDFHLQVAFNMKEIFINGQKIPEDPAAYLHNDELMMPNLFQILAREADILKEEASRNPLSQFSGKIIIQADKNVPFRLLKKVMFTADRADFTRQSLVLYQR